jgi:hypothetical protein
MIFDRIGNFLARFWHTRDLKVILIRSDSKSNEGSWWFVDSKWLSLANPVLTWKVGKQIKKFVPLPEAYIHMPRLHGLSYAPTCYVDWETGFPIIFKGQKRILPATKYGTIINDDMLGSFLSRKEKVLYFAIIIILAVGLMISVFYNFQLALTRPQYIPPSP